MVLNNPKKSKIEPFWLILFLVTTLANAQKTEHPYQKYYQWGIVGGINNFTQAKMTANYTDANVLYKITNSYDFTYGIDYNIFINNNWFYNFGINVKWFGDKEFYFLGENESMLPVDWKETSWTNPDFTLAVPINIIYTKNFLKNIYFTIGGGLELTYYRYTDTMISGLSIDNLEIYKAIYESNKNPFYLGAQIEAGFGIELGKLLLQPKIIYSKSFKS